MVRSFPKGTEISYKYATTGTYDVTFSDNISAFCFTGQGQNELKNQLKTIKRMNKNVKEILPNSFDNCQKLQMVDVGSASIERIQSNAFSGCQNLAVMIVPEGLIQDGMAESSLNNLTNLRIFSYRNHERDE